MVARKRISGIRASSQKKASAETAVDRCKVSDDT